ncbi:MAG: FAD:protein FMN transferase [Nannocystaceae bacterium]|nr:FAD:protein FMN transferase [Nannocystaceae bacterium]
MKWRGRTALWLPPLAFALACDGGPAPTTSGAAPVAAPVTAEAQAVESKTSGPTDANADTDADPSAPPVRKDGTIYADAELMGTRVSLNVWLPPDKTAAEAGAAMQAALDAMSRIEDMMSEWQADSELSRISAAAGGEAVAVSPELVEILARARVIAAETQGAFDPTFHGVGQLWSFAPGATPPPAAAIAEKLPLVNYRNLHVDREAQVVRLAKAGMMLGLGAIAKGYAVDRASAVLVARGLIHHVVEAGGDTYASGTKNGKPWAVGIQAPDKRGVVGVLPTSGRAVVTSGNYQRYFEHDGVRYAHILDPRTGWPITAERSPRSVTVVAANATDADAYATAIAVMGVQTGMAFVEANDALEAVVIDGTDKVHISSGLRDQLVVPQ